MVINTNTSSATSARLLSESSNMLSKSLARLSSGSKLISPEDDAAGLAVSMRFDSQVSRISAVRSNVGNAVSFNQTQDGFLKKVSVALDRMSELSTLALDVTKTDGDRALYDAEFQKLQDYVIDLGTKEFNGVSLFSGTDLNVTIDSDANSIAVTGVSLGGATMAAATTAGDIATAATAKTALDAVKLAVTQLATDRANIGSNIAVLNSYNSQLGVLKDNLSAANSRIKDVDVAEESASFAKYNILVQAGTSMLAQANTTPQSVLRLLQ